MSDQHTTTVNFILSLLQLLLMLLWSHPKALDVGTSSSVVKEENLAGLLVRDGDGENVLDWVNKTHLNHVHVLALIAIACVRSVWALWVVVSLQGAGSMTGLESGHPYSGYLRVCMERERAPHCQQCDVDNSVPLSSSLYHIVRERERACMVALSSLWWWWHVGP